MQRVHNKSKLGTSTGSTGLGLMLIPALPFVWLDPINAFGTTWLNKSGNNNTFTARYNLNAGQAFNLQPTIDLSGNNEIYMTTAGNAMTGITQFTVTRPSTVSADASRLLSVSPNADADWQSGLSFSAGTSFLVQNVTGYSTVTMTNGVNQILVSRIGDGYAQNWTYRKGVTDTGSRDVKTISMTTTRYCLGSSVAAGGPDYLSHWNAPIAEHIMWLRNLTDAEMATVINYLKTKYNL